MGERTYRQNPFKEKRNKIIRTMWNSGMQAKEILARIRGKYAYFCTLNAIYHAVHEQEAWARGVVAGCIRRGEIKKAVCVVCGGIRSEAHHEDYDKPKEIVWLCKKHHVEADKKRRERLNSANFASGH